MRLAAFQRPQKRLERGPSTDGAAIDGRCFGLGLAAVAVDPFGRTAPRLGSHLACFALGAADPLIAALFRRVDSPLSFPFGLVDFVKGQPHRIRRYFVTQSTLRA